jgi:4-diphosphocytidyl-2-C-methyl-D-erythritol kinase
MIAELAPAKLNLHLHVGPRRADGLHELDSVFVFVEIGDILTAAPADDLSLDIVGPFAAPLAKESPARNLVLRAAHALREHCGIAQGAKLTLDKRLPIAAGLGGGSADAAAALRALTRLWGLKISRSAIGRIAFALGADVPACLDRAPIHVSGAGETIRPGPALPPLWACLVNPRVAMPTGDAFRLYDLQNPRPRAPERVSMNGPTYRNVTRFMKNSRNDLQPIAINRHFVVQHVLDCLVRRPGAIAARMSGSGATVFGLFTSPEGALRAARAAACEGWWSMGARIFGGGARVGEA